MTRCLKNNSSSVTKPQFLRNEIVGLFSIQDFCYTILTESASWTMFYWWERERKLPNIFWLIGLFLKQPIRNNEFLTSCSSLTEVCAMVHSELVLPNIISWIYHEEDKYNFPDFQTCISVVHDHWSRNRAQLPMTNTNLNLCTIVLSKINIPGVWFWFSFLGPLWSLLNLISSQRPN